MSDIIYYNMLEMIANISNRFNIPQNELKKLFRDTCKYTKIKRDATVINDKIFRDLANNKYVLLSNISDNIFYALSIK